jgi:hypothetical protein
MYDFRFTITDFRIGVLKKQAAKINQNRRFIKPIKTLTISLSGKQSMRRLHIEVTHWQH